MVSRNDRPIFGSRRSLVGRRRDHIVGWVHRTHPLQGGLRGRFHGAALNQTLSCASASYNLHITANVVSNGGGVSGSWSESTHSVSGSISGRANSSDIQAYVSGAGFSASIGIRTHGGGQSVTIRPQAGTDVRAMSITLHRG